MKNSLRITVKKPCSEKFENFSKTANGGFCNSCEKEVIDFTNMSQSELMPYFCHTNRNICGRFKTSQLTDYNRNELNHSGMNILSKGIGAMTFSLLSLCTLSSVKAQELSTGNTTVHTELVATANHVANNSISIEKYTVKGTVLDEDNLPLPGVSIVLKGTTTGVSTDFEGRFEFPITLEANDVLVFSYLGYDAKEYRVPNSKTDTIEITIIFEATDIELMGEVVVGGAYVSKRTIFQKFIALFK
ncbi:MAG: carboxypeptidase-like regulatory domain-containing protein [Maribacter sp.]|uniref:carboxypeptidase-like regulatory domain-containing protein n=1 Tax=Maribacter sp. TaxID=1897614 RepID=UPI003C7685A7